MNHFAKIPIFLFSASCFCSSPAEAGLVYWSGDSKIFRAQEDGSSITELITTNVYGSGYNQGLAVNNSSIFWSKSGIIYRANLDGTGTSSIISGVSPMIRDLAINSNSIYYVSSNGIGTAKLYKSNIDGTSPTLLLSSSAGSNDLDSIAANDSYIWYGINNDGLYRANIDGSSATRIVTTSDTNIFTLSLGDDGKIYWTSGSPSTNVYSADLDGSNVTSIRSVSWGMSPMSTGGGYIFHAIGDGTTFVRSDLDGSNELTIQSGIYVPSIAYGADTSVTPEPASVFAFFGLLSTFGLGFREWRARRKAKET